MPDIYANVLDVVEYNIGTTAGTLKGHLYYLDVDIDPSSGIVYHPIITSPDKFYPFKTELSVLVSHQNGQSLPTIFSFSYGKYDVRCFYDPNIGPNSYAYKIYDTSVVPEVVVYTDNIYTSSNGGFYYSSDILVGTNGVAVMSTVAESGNIGNFSPSDGAVLENNTPSSFGTFKAPNAGYSGYAWTMRSSSALLGEIYYNSSGLKDLDPYAPGGTSKPGGGDGDFDDDTDPINIPSLPSLSASDTGFITLYNPTLAQLQSLAHYMWSDPAFDLTTLTKLFADPMDVILGLSILPVAIPNSGAVNLYVGNIDTGIQMYKASSQYVQVDCGSITISKYWGSYLDYSPYTKIQLYLPFIGIREINIDDVMAQTVNITYNIDILTGGCVAFVKCGNSVKYEYIGQCSMNIPITSSNYTSIINGVLSIAGAVGATVATGGATAPMAVGAIASTAVNDLKPSFERSGNISGASALLANKKPFFLMERPNQCVPSNQNRYIGYPSFITKKIGDITGYNEIETTRLTGMSCTADECDEIMEILKSGVII